MKTYENYKYSGLEWIGEIPEHWSNVSLKWISKIYSGGTPSKNKPEYWSGGTIPWLNSGTVNQGDITEASEYITDEALANSSAKWIPEKAILIALAGQGKTKGMVAQTQFKATCNQSLGIIVPNYTELNRFLLYWLRKNYQNIRNLGGGDKRDGVNLEMIGSIPVPLPTKEEQTAIANYLDKKTAKIDQLIAEKIQLVSLYQEEKKALINQAVTKGINPDVKLKDSGIEYLGDIPEHWQIKKIGHCGKIVRGGSPRPSGDPRYFMGDFIHWITVKEVTNAVGKYIVDSEEFLTEEGSKRSRIIEPETLLLSNSGATLGVPKISKIKGCINDGSVAFPELKTFLDRDFLYYFFERHTEIYRDEMAGNGQPNLNTEIIKSTSIPIPATIEEQKEIIQHIEKESARIDAKISKAEKYIKLLTEYKSTLISEVVTGKIKVIN